MSAIAKTVASPRTWTVEFESAYSEGRFREAARIFDGHATGDVPIGLVLRAARANLPTRASKALRLLLELEIPPSKLRDHVERHCFLAEAYARTQDFESADASLADALGTAREFGDPDMLAAVGFRSVRRHLFAEDAGSARRALDLARSGQSKESHVYALVAEISILPYEERLAEQTPLLIELLRSLDPTDASFADVRAWATHSLALLTRDTFIPDAVSEVDRQLNGIPWPSDYAPNLFQTHKALGWAKALQGDTFNAFRHLKRASEAADSNSWKVVAACDRAYLARCFDEHRWSRIELDEAERLAEEVDWDATRGEERMGLLLLAQLFSSLDGAKATMYLARYRELGDIKSPLINRHDARLQAFAQYSAGMVDIALGNRKQGIDALKRAYKVFERFGYDFRAAACLAAEYEISGNRELLPTLEEKLRNYPQSWLAAKMRSTSERPVVPLPPMQKRVFEEICQGKSTAEIALTLERSEFTISNHIKEIFKTFGVKSRSALVAEALRRGLIQQQTA